MAKKTVMGDVPVSLPDKRAGDVSVQEEETTFPNEAVALASLRYFTSKQEAEEHAAESIGKGFNAVVKQETVQDDKTVYTVFSEKPVEAIASQPVAETISDSSERPAGSLLVPEKRSLLAPEPTPPAPEPSAMGKPSVSESPAAIAGEHVGCSSYR